MHALASAAERFKEATGFYPLADLNSDLPIAVHFSKRRLPKAYRNPPPNRSGVVWDAGAFADYLSHHLSSAVELPKDDRRVEDLPYFYVYSFDGSNYFVAAVLDQATQETRNVADLYEKYEVGSKAVPERKIERFGGTPQDVPAIEPYRTEAEFLPREVDRPAVLELLRRREFDRLESMLDKLVEAARQDPRREEGLNIVLQTLGSGESWMGRHFDAWAAKKPDSRWAHVARARYLYGAGYRARGGGWAKDTEESQFEEMGRLHRQAVEEARRALELDDRLLDPYVVMIDIAKTTPRQEVCESLAREALAIEPASYRIWHIAVGCQVPKWGGSLGAMHRLALEAQQHADRNPRLQALLGYVDMELGDAHRIADRLPAALEAYDRALAAGEHPHFYEYRANVLAKLDRREEALADRTRGLELSPQNVDLLADRVLSLASLGRFDEMTADLELATLIEPTDSTVQFCHDNKLYRRAGGFAYALYKEGRVAESRELFTEILANDPDYAYGYHCLGLTYKDSDPERALELFERSMEANPGYYEPHPYVHWLRGKKRQWPRVLEMWDNYLKLAPEEPRAYFKRAEAHKRLGHKVAATSDLREACGLGYEEACEKPPPTGLRTEATSDEKSRYGAQPTPELAWERFLEINARGVNSAKLGIYDAEAQAILRGKPAGHGQAEIAALYKDARPEIRTRDELAAVVFPDDREYRLAPWFFRRSAEGWQFNGSMYPHVIGYNQQNQWRFRTTDHPYAWAFADFEIGENGFARSRQTR